MLDDIAYVAPETVRIKSLSNNGSSKIMLDGSGLSYEAVRLFVDTLNSCRDIESAVLLATENPNDSEGLVDFSIRCSLIQ